VEARVDIGGAALNAALNAALQRDGSGQSYRVGDENGITLLQTASAGKRLAAVCRLPYMDRIRAAAAHSWVLEEEPGGDELPLSAMAEVLPQADVVGIIGTALVDGTLERALGSCRPDAYVLLVGPSTPLSPVLFNYGVAALSGSVVADAERVLAQLRAPHDGPTPRLAGMKPVTLHRLPGPSLFGPGENRSLQSPR
jgi:uncharacterized protein (DUF4213/DUF364 family)